MSTLRKGVKRSRAFSPNTAHTLSRWSTLTQQKNTLSTLYPNNFQLDKENIDPNMTKEEGVLNNNKILPFEDLKGLVIELEGNIGSGKSTLCRLVRDIVHKDSNDTMECSVFYESINNDFLAAFYTNTKKYSFAFQMYMLTTRLYQMDESYRVAEKDDNLSLLDRGAVGDTVFALLNHQMGNMNDEEIQIYKSVCQQRMPASISERVDIVFYLDVSPSECHRRVTKERLNEAESGVPLSYLEAVDECYFHLLMDWFGNRKGSYHELNIGKPPRVIVLRWEQYGNARDAIKQIQALLHGQRQSPIVEFTIHRPTSHHEVLILDTKDDIDARYELLKNNNMPYEHDDNNQTDTLYINWELKHDNAYRRIAMYFLSIQGKVVFYGHSTATKGTD